MIDRLHYLGLMISLGLTWGSWSLQTRTNEAISGLELGSAAFSLARESGAFHQSVTLLQTGAVIRDPSLVAAGLDALKKQEERLDGMDPGLAREIAGVRALAAPLASDPRGSSPARLAETAAAAGERLRGAAQDRFERFKAAYLAEVTDLESLRRLVLGLSALISVFLFLYSLFISQKRRAHELLSRTQELHNLMFSSLQEGVLYCRPDGSILSCNQSAGGILGWDVRDLPGNKISQVLGRLRGEDGRPYLDGSLAIEEALGKGRVIKHMPLGITLPDGEPRWIYFRAQPVLSAQGEDPFAMLVTVTDATSAVTAQRQLDAERAQAAESAKLAALGEMAGEVAHEVNNPLTVIETSVDLLEMKMRGELQMEKGALEKTLESIRKMVARATGITRAVLTYARGGQADAFEEASLRILIEDSLAICAPRLRKSGAQVSVAEIPESLKIKARVAQLSRVIINLVNNAADELAGKPDGMIRIEAERAADRLLIRVRDNGPGIPPAIRAKLFMPFFTSKPVGKGTGLGLSVSKTIVEAHGGRLYLEEGQSTCFVIDIPVEPAEPPAEAGAKAA